MKIAAFIDTATSFGEDILWGIQDYQSRYAPHWQLFFVETPFSADYLPEEFKNWKGDGVIVRSNSQDFVRRVTRPHVAVLDLGDEHYFGFPTVCYNHLKIAKLAVEHFVDRRIQNLFYIGYEEREYDIIRAEAFIEEARMLGCRSKVRFLTSSEENALSRQQDFLEFMVKESPKPLGIFAGDDILGVRLIKMVQNMKYHVPDDVAVLGCGNDVLCCEWGFPALSSIPTCGKRFGFISAKYFDGLLQGTETPCRLPILVSPRPVVLRGSSDIHAVWDSKLQLALQLIRKKACQGLCVEDISAATGLPRRTLERKFQQFLNRSPHAEIMRVQVETTQRLLLETNLSLEEIAQKAGFHSVSHLCVSLKRAIHKTPGEFRREAREKLKFCI